MTEACPMRSVMRRLSSRSGIANPHPIYDELREDAPIQDTPYFGHALTRHADVRAVLFDRTLKVSSAAAKPGSARAEIANVRPEDLRRLPAWLFLMDDPDHKRLRKIIAPRFAQSAINALRPRIALYVTELLDALDGRDAFDLIPEFAAPLPLYIVADLLGVRTEYKMAFRMWSEGLIHELHSLASAEQRADAIAGHRALAAFFHNEIADRRIHPGPDIITDLVKASDEGKLTEDEIISLCVNLLVAGHLTTSDLIASLLFLLLSHPEEYARLRAEPSLWPTAVEEALRMEPPTPLLARVHASRATIHGADFEAGDTINVFIAAANRDPRRFQCPHRFDVARDDNPHLSFGGGDHFCLGAPLARAEGEIAVRLLLERRPHLRLVENASEWRRSMNFRGLARLDVREEKKSCL